MKKIMIETSAHHVHVTSEVLEKLFGKGATLTNKKELSQPGQFVCFERVDIVGPKSTIKSVSILGPVRKYTQAEISLTEARKIGVQIPIRESGKIEGSAGCKLVGPKGEYEMTEGLIAASRHMHCSPENAEKFGIKDGDEVSVDVKSEKRPVTFHNVKVRVDEGFNATVHIDTDEANAAGLTETVYGEIL